MNKKQSPYVKKSRSWIIKNVLANYFKAYNLNKEVKILREKLNEQAELNKVMGNSPEIKKIIKQVFCKI